MSGSFQTSLLSENVSTEPNRRLGDYEHRCPHRTFLASDCQVLMESSQPPGHCSKKWCCHCYPLPSANASDPHATPARGRMRFEGHAGCKHQSHHFESGAESHVWHHLTWQRPRPSGWDHTHKQLGPALHCWPILAISSFHRAATTLPSPIRMLKTMPC